MFQRDIERGPDEREGLRRAPARREEEGLGVQRLGHDLGQPQALRDLEGALVAFIRKIALPGEEHESADLGRERGEVRVGLLLGQDRKRPIHVLEPLLDPAAVPHHLGKARRDARGRMRRVGRLKALHRTFEVPGGLVEAGACVGHHPGSLQELCLQQRVVGELGRPHVGALGLGIRGERRRAVGRSNEHLPRLVADVPRVLRIRRGVVGVEVMRRDDLGDLVVLGAPGGREELRGREVLGLALPPGDRLVGDAPHDVLEERVLPALG